tara:strand:- start:1 stop:315 length:315 start_codon:yes stop_codon:yes gene_type:complete
MKNYEIEYRDCISMRTVVEMEGITEKQAIINLQIELIDTGDYMTQLIDIQEVEDDDDEWTLEDGTPLDQDSQGALNDAMLDMVNEDGMTLKQVLDKEIEDNKNK